MIATIVLLIKNGARFLCEVLEGIQRQEGDLDVHVLAIDSGSTDGSLDILARYGIKTVRIPPASFNHGDTRNLGARLAGEETDFVVYLTQDATPAGPAWLRCLVEPLRKDDRTAGAFSRHVARPQSSPALVRQLTERWQTGQTTRLVKELPDDRDVYERDKLYYAYFSDTSSVIRRSVWKSIPFPRTDFAEDAAWADRVLIGGHRIVFEPKSAVVHSHDYSLIEQFRQNVDHAAGMRTLFPEVLALDASGWVRVFLAVPLEVLLDWRFIRDFPGFAGKRIPRKALWGLHSPLWHSASVLGTWVGAHLERWPSSVRSVLSRQERLRHGKQ